MDRLVTVFGGGGFLGRYVVRALTQRGARVRIAERHPKSAYFVRTQGGLGQTQFVAADITRAETVAAAVRGADSVINLVGVMAGNVDAIHVDGACNVATAAREAEADVLVHVSAIGADATAPAQYARSKGEGEAAVRGAFPAATILRPSVLFGPEDAFFNRFAQMARFMSVLPVLRGTTRFQPAYVADVAEAIAVAATDPARAAGATFELGGPRIMTMTEITRFSAETGGHPRPLFEVPDAAGAMIAKLGFLPGAPITTDQWLMLGSDNVVGPQARGFADLGIEPTPAEAVAPAWMVKYRRQGRFAKKRAA